MKLRERLRILVTTNRRPKLICLLLAIIVWMWVNYFYVQDENTVWDDDEIRISLPE